MVSEYRMLPLLADRIPFVWKFVWPHLEPVARQDPEFDPVKATEMILSGMTQIWMAVNDEDDIVGALCTTVVSDADHEGKKALDVHGLGGSKFSEWAPVAAQLMRDWAAVNGCHRIVFQGRKGLRRLHKPLGNVVEVGTKNGEFLYEVSLT